MRSRSVGYGEGRDALVSATVDVAAERGLGRITFRAVAERAAVNNSLIAHHFGTKEDLLAAALEWAVEQSIEGTGLVTLESEEAFAAALLAQLRERPELHLFQYAMIVEARYNPRYIPPVTRLYERYHEVLRRSLAMHGIRTDLDAVARHLFAAFDGLVLQVVTGVSPEQVLLDGLRALWSDLGRNPEFREVPLQTVSAARTGP